MSLLGVYGKPAIHIDRGLGDEVWSGDRKLLDMSGGIAVNALGHAAPEIAKAVADQAKTLIHTSNLYGNEPSRRLAGMLSERTYGHHVFFTNSGTEANEAAYKAIRRHAHDEGRKGVIVAFEGGFHGRSMGALGLTHKPAARNGFGALPDDIVHLPWNDAAALKGLADSQEVLGIVCEVIQGEAGVRPMSQELAQQITKIQQDDDALLLIDEVQTGIGRTGTFWAHEQWGLTPDIVTSAKALGGGMPIGACMMSERVAGHMTVGTHGSTFGGNPVACAAAMAVIETIEKEGLMERATELGDRFLARAKEAGLDARGKGLLLGVQADAGKVVDAMQEDGILVVKAGDETVRLAPSLRVTQEAMDRSLERLVAHIRP